MRLIVAVTGIGAALFMWPGWVCAEGADQVLILQDENYFLREENQALRQELARLKKALSDQQACGKILAEKSSRNNALLRQVAQQKQQLEQTTGEKLSLRDSLKIVADELEAQKASSEKELARERDACASRSDELNARLKSKEDNVQLRINAACKPFQEQITVLGVRLKTQENAARTQVDALNAAMAERAQQCLQQVSSLRESAAQVQRNVDASSVRIKELQDRLTACQTPPAVKK